MKPAAIAPQRLRVSFVGPLLAHVLTLIPLLSPRRQRDRQARRWERQIDRQLQNLEILTLAHEIERDARIILNDPDVTPATRQAAERILANATKLVDVERQDVHRDDQEGGELRVVDREIGDLAVAHKALERAGVLRDRRWRP
jgi:hypothetical protein